MCIQLILASEQKICSALLEALESKHYLDFEFVFPKLEIRTRKGASNRCVEPQIKINQLWSSLSKIGIRTVDELDNIDN